LDAGREGGEIGVLWDVLTCVFDEAFLPGGVWVCEINLGMEHFGDIFVVGGLGSDVGGMEGGHEWLDLHSDFFCNRIQ